MTLSLANHLGADSAHRALRRDVFEGLQETPKSLPPKWFYDSVGSDLFDQITRLPEYYPTRAEAQILRASSAEIASASQADTLVELGAGTSEKTRLLLDALRDAGRYADSCRSTSTPGCSQQPRQPSRANTRASKSRPSAAISRNI